MLDNLARKNEAGATLPPFIRVKLESLGYRPTLGELARLLKRDKSTLGRHMSGKSEMGLATAVALAELLDVTLDELVHNVGVLTGP